MGFHRPLAPLVRGTPVPSSGATGQAEDAEKNNFSIAAFSAATEKYSAALLQKNKRHQTLWLKALTRASYYPKG